MFPPCSFKVSIAEATSASFSKVSKPVPTCSAITLAPFSTLAVLSATIISLNSLSISLSLSDSVFVRLELSEILTLDILVGRQASCAYWLVWDLLLYLFWLW